MCFKGGGGGYQAFLFGNINFEIAVAQQGPYMYQHFGEVSGPWRPTGSEPRPALIWAPGIAIWLFWFLVVIWGTKLFL